MATTLVGVFDDHSDAQRACEKLYAAGIDRDAVQVTSGNTATMGDPSAISSDTGARRQEEQGGIRGFFASLFGSDDEDESSGHYSEAVRRGNAVVTVSVSDDARVDQVSDILEDCGAIDVDERVERWKSAGYSGYDEAAPALSQDEIAREREQMKVIQEDLKIGKRKVQEGGVRVRRHLTETPVEEQVTLRDERAVVDRQRVDRPASAADLDSFKEGEFEVRETREEPVVSKSARVVEEVSIGKQAAERTETVRDTVRRSDVEVEQLGAAGKGMHWRGAERRTNSGAQYPGAERRAQV